MRWDKPEVYGVACKRVDVRERQSVFNSRPQFAGVMHRLLNTIQAPVLVVSFNNEGWSVPIPRTTAYDRVSGMMG